MFCFRALHGFLKWSAKSPNNAGSSAAVVVRRAAVGRRMHACECVSAPWNADVTISSLGRSVSTCQSSDHDNS